MKNLTRLFTEKRIRVLKLITEHEGLHIRDIAEKTGTTPAAVHNAIKLFKETGIASEKKVKNRKTVSINRNSTIFKKIKSLLNIFELQNKKAFGELQKYGKVGIYGSFARGDDTPESDIDMWLYSNNKINAIKLKDITRDLERNLGKEVRLLILDDDKIRRLKEKDPEFYFRLKLTSIGEDIFG